MTDRAALRSVALMAAVAGGLRAGYEQQTAQAIQTHSRVRAYFRGSRICGCGRTISANKPKCRACGEAA